MEAPKEADNVTVETESDNAEEGLKEEIETQKGSESIVNYEEKTRSDEEEHSEITEELETAADEFLQERSEESSYKKT